MKSSPSLMDSVKSPLADLITSTLVQACISSRSSDRLWRLVHDGNEIVIFENAEDKTQYLLIKNAITPLLMAYSELRSELNLRIYPCLSWPSYRCLPFRVAINFICKLAKEIIALPFSVRTIDRFDNHIFG